jgi:transposase
MGYIAIGGDVSKGRLDIVIRNESGTRLHAGVYDDTAAGHRALQRELAALRERHPGAVFLAGLESTGAMERNWLALLRAERRWTKGMQVHLLSPAQVQRYLSVDLHRSVTDVHAADGIARYLLERVRDRQAEEREPSAAVQFYRTLRSVMHRRMEVEQQIHAVLIQIHPELVQYCSSGFPGWIIELLERYPTAADLAAAPVAAVDAIRFVMPDRATALVRAAQESVASLTGPAAQGTMRLLVRQWRDLERAITDGQKTIAALVAADPVHREQARLMATIPGIGDWTAQVLSLELGDLARFRDDRALVAWCGLDPHEDRSGDGVIKRGISHRGNAQVRRALFMPALTAAKRLPAIADLDRRLRAAGKRPLVAAVACMHKLLRIAFAVVLSGKDFDPEHEAHRRQQAAAQQKTRSAAPADPVRILQDLAAPVSAEQARLRRRAKKAAARVLPGCEVVPQRGCRRADGAVDPVKPLA